MNRGANGLSPDGGIIEIPGKLAGIAALRITTKGNALTGIEFVNLQTNPYPHLNTNKINNKTCDLHPTKCTRNNTSDYTRTVVNQLSRYFEDPDWLFTLNIETHGTEFQQQVWRQLEKISVKKHCTYGELAKKLSTSPRAIGNACRSNPVPIVVPCHRVVSAKGAGGYCGTSDADSFELKIKNWLLDHEKSDG